MTHTFQVAELDPHEHAFRHLKATPWLEQECVQDKVPGKTLHASQTTTIGGPSPLFSSLSLAFNLHVPWVITPDSVWLTCLVGLTHHIDSDPEGLRQHFVPHEGQKTLTIVLSGSSINTVSGSDWENGVRDFSAQLRENLHPKRHDLIVNNFSTTTDVDRLSSEITLMGAMKHYFRYYGMLLCGLTKVTIEGTSEDWANIIARAEALSEFGLSWWTDQLIPVFRQFKRASEGDPDIAFWQRAYLEHRVGSGGDFNVSGWINALYPYIVGRKPGTMTRNPFIEWEANDKRGLAEHDFPSGLVSAPVTINDRGTEYSCKFYGGLVGVSMARDRTMKAVSGYAIQLE